MKPLASWAAALGNGARRRCPRCGDGPLFRGWTRMRDRCPACGLRYLNSPGDPWGFLLVLDRAVFILPPIAILYFGWLPRSLAAIVAVFAAWATLLLYTTPHRYGVCVALDWLTRSDDGTVDRWDNAGLPPSPANGRDRPDDWKRT